MIYSDVRQVKSKSGKGKTRHQLVITAVQSLLVQRAYELPCWPYGLCHALCHDVTFVLQMVNSCVVDHVEIETWHVASQGPVH